jgi:hypothetical protein
MKYFTCYFLFRCFCVILNQSYCIILRKPKRPDNIWPVILQFLYITKKQALNLIRQRSIYSGQRWSGPQVFPIVRPGVTPGKIVIKAKSVELKECSIEIVAE